MCPEMAFIQQLKRMDIYLMLNIMEEWNDGPVVCISTSTGVHSSCEPDKPFDI